MTPKSSSCDSLKHLDFSVDCKSQETIDQGIAKVVACFKPEWDVAQLSTKTLSGGTTNTLILCEYKPTEYKFLTRIYGAKTELFIDRDAELKNMQLLQAHSLGPQVLCAFKNGLCYAYFEGKTFDLDMVFDKRLCLKIAAQLAKIHAIPLPADSQPCIIPMLEKYLDLVPKSVLDPIQDRFSKQIGKPVDFKNELDVVKKSYRNLKSPVVFCHNDLLSKNIILDGEEVHFIDYEYAAANFQAFDIGNFFCEFGGQDSYDPSLYPDSAFQQDWIRAYLTKFHELKGLAAPTDGQVKELYVTVNKFSLSSLLLWSFWAMIQKAYSQIDFDFGKMVVDRLGMYFLKRDEFLAL